MSILGMFLLKLSKRPGAVIGYEDRNTTWQAKQLGAYYRLVINLRSTSLQLKSQELQDADPT